MPQNDRLSLLPGRTWIARHGETVFNAARRLQGEIVHTPLTGAGVAQAQAIGAALRDARLIGPRARLWASPTGRTLQTMALICEQIHRDWHEVETDARLSEIGMGGWDGRAYADVEAEAGPIYDAAMQMFVARAPAGEGYAEVAARVREWAEEQRGSEDRLIVTHGVTGGVLRGLLVGGRAHPTCGTLVADPLPQGSIVLIEDGIETVVHRGRGEAPA